MNKERERRLSERMIHIRLDNETHRKLKMHAAASGATIQQLVENLIRNEYDGMQVRNVKP